MKIATLTFIHKHAKSSVLCQVIKRANEFVLEFDWGQKRYTANFKDSDKGFICSHKSPVEFRAIGKWENSSRFTGYWDEAGEIQEILVEA